MERGPLATQSDTGYRILGIAIVTLGPAAFWSALAWLIAKNAGVQNPAEPAMSVFWVAAVFLAVVISLLRAISRR